MAEVDAEFDAAVDGKGADICLWLSDNRERLNFSDDAESDEYRKTKVIQRLADPLFGA